MPSDREPRPAIAAMRIRRVFDVPEGAGLLWWDREAESATSCSSALLSPGSIRSSRGAYLVSAPRAATDAPYPLLPGRETDPRCEGHRAKAHRAPARAQAASRGGGWWEDLSRTGRIEHLVMSEHIVDDDEFFRRRFHGEQIHLSREASVPGLSRASVLWDLTIAALGAPRLSAIGLALALRRRGMEEGSPPRFVVNGEHEIDFGLVDGVREAIEHPPKSPDSTGHALPRDLLHARRCRDLPGRRAPPPHERSGEGGGRRARAEAPRGGVPRRGTAHGAPPSRAPRGLEAWRRGIGRGFNRGDAVSAPSNHPEPRQLALLDPALLPRAERVLGPGARAWRVSPSRAGVRRILIRAHSTRCAQGPGRSGPRKPSHPPGDRGRGAARAVSPRTPPCPEAHAAPSRDEAILRARVGERPPRGFFVAVPRLAGPGSTVPRLAGPGSNTPRLAGPGNNVPRLAGPGSKVRRDVTDALWIAAPLVPRFLSYLEGAPPLVWDAFRIHAAPGGIRRARTRSRPSGARRPGPRARRPAPRGRVPRRPRAPHSAWRAGAGPSRPRRDRGRHADPYRARPHRLRADRAGNGGGRPSPPRLDTGRRHPLARRRRALARGPPLARCRGEALRRPRSREPGGRAAPARPRGCASRSRGAGKRKARRAT